MSWVVFVSLLALAVTLTTAAQVAINASESNPEREGIRRAMHQWIDENDRLISDMQQRMQEVRERTGAVVENDPAIPDEFEVHLKPEDWNWYHRQLAYGRGEENWYEHSCARCDPNFVPPKPIAFVKPSDLPEGHDCLVSNCDTVTETDMNGIARTAVTAHNVTDPLQGVVERWTGTRWSTSASPRVFIRQTPGTSGNWSTWDA